MSHDQRAASVPALELPSRSAQPTLLRWAEELAFREPIEPLPSGCAKRAAIVGVCTLVGHPVFYALWKVWAPQPYENLWLRLAMALCGAVLIALPKIREKRPKRRTGVLYSLLLWLTLPFFFSWMLLFNAASTVSIVATGAMFLIYYQLTDWRLASIGTAAALLVVRLIAPLAGWAGIDVGLDTWISDVAILAFCWLVGCLLGFSSIGVRRAQAKTTSSAVGIFAHELRTPLATLHMLAHAVREVEPGSDRARDRLSSISERIEGTIHRMNRQIDLQISTARLGATPSTQERVRAADIVHAVVASFPFADGEAAWLAVDVRQDFEFQGSPQLFTQVLENLIKNAVRALRAAPADRARRLCIRIDTEGEAGVLTIKDNGVGMPSELASRVFEPFVSTQGGGTHGLGLTFCAETVRALGGDICVASSADAGAEFTIRLPLA